MNLLPTIVFLFFQTPSPIPASSGTGFFSNTVICAFVGGLAVKFLDLLERNNLPPERRPTLNALYWTALLVLPILGAFIVWAYSQEREIGSILAIQIGASAPLIIKSLAGAVPPINTGTSKPQTADSTAPPNPNTATNPLDQP